ncbi:site-specific integrase [Pontibacillus yanchengensis]|uniref:Integrase n=1 Tax=Pontibacillus yanchengensis Y32 TaxID=1385514 RepID=A0A0A2TDU6_9BACI|nr:site-specific integrase [Pontibacillus yanchengensis]KGP73714.1 hypothetical protein N782_02290 [Pontibacillus yanchengensis Y32]
MRYDIGIESNTGKRIQKSKGGFNTRREAERYLNENLYKLNDKQTNKVDDVYFEAYFEEWFETMYKKKVSTSTWEGRQYTMNLHILPKFRNHKLRSITSYELDTFYAQKVEEGLSPKTVKEIHCFIRMALAQAVKWGYMDRNPAEDATIPKQVNKEVIIWDYQTAMTFLKTARIEKKDAIYATALFTGMRRGELLGLKWSDVDLDKKKISINRSLSVTKSEGYILSRTKTVNSRRQISISPFVVEVLIRHKEYQEEQKAELREGYTDQDLVFPNLFGGFKNPDNLRREYNALIEKAKVPRINIHALRHTHATWLLKNGVNPKVVSERLGHHDVGITLRTYSHVSFDLQEEAAQKLEETVQKFFDPTIKQ